MSAYACDPARSRGRRYPEAATPYRTEFQRDRDRIVHSTSFRRLVYKTQVFLNHEGDLYRTRMTHSLEVAQLGRSIARALQLNEDLVEAIALAHDLGHTPFGHAGQEALDDCMKSHGGFEHNLQSLRIVDVLEQRYPQYDGLNLCFETREGILKHCSLSMARELESLEPAYPTGTGGVAQRFLERAQPSLEAQLCNLADEIAYNAHDVDDGIRSGLITHEQMQEVALYREFTEQVLASHPHIVDGSGQRRLMYESIRLMLSAQVHDVIAASQAAIAKSQPQTVDDVRAAKPLIVFSQEMRREVSALKKFLFRHLYRHPRVVETMSVAKEVVQDLFRAYQKNPMEMQRGVGVSDVLQSPKRTQCVPIERTICDYIAGMTDRFAEKEHRRLTGRVATASAVSCLGVRHEG